MRLGELELGAPRRIRTDTILLLRETPHTNWARGAILVVGIGIEPISEPYQDSANPSQLTDHCMASPEGFEPPTNRVEAGCSCPLS